MPTFSERVLIGFSLFRWIGPSLRIFTSGGDMVAKFRLEPVALQRAGGFSRHELNVLAKLVSEHRERLLEGWNEFFGR
jgi:hypothetical protein